MESDLCKCGNKRRPKQRNCLECHAAWIRQWRKTHKLTGEQKWKAKVRSHTKMSVLRGLIKKQPCEVCGDEKVEAHHDDYTKHDQVRWLCFKHHREHHRELKVMA